MLSLIGLLVCNGIRMDDDALDLDRAHWPIFCSHRLLLDLIKRIKTINQAPKRGVDTVQVRLSAVREEKLRTVGVGPGVDHRQTASSFMLQGGDKLVLEIATIDTLSSLTRASRIAALNHETLDVSVEGRVV